MTRAIVVLLSVLALSLSMISIARAVEPGEALTDPVLEERARGLSQGLRCLVCQNQSIDDSDAPLARDLRLLVRERIAAGDSDSDVLDFVVARYGEFVLLKPRFNARTYLLWAVPALVLIVGGLIVLLNIRKAKATSVPEALTEAEKERLAEIVNDRER
ncbi:MAG: cytochrome c-type biogenesis protein CcmH [Alphaproteobacteria bacterium]|nr:cytochrome c-type biogenesis protein CcmH [Alphaproteobacteria bacterium]MBO6628854.1 cytochrome c-type biogenesis protein CcmH [Alphaproteobacteria bacterium]